jgi:hypothetical protein
MDSEANPTPVKDEPKSITTIIHFINYPLVVLIELINEQERCQKLGMKNRQLFPVRWQIII